MIAAYPANGDTSALVTQYVVGDELPDQRPYCSAGRLAARIGGDVAAEEVLQFKGA